MILHNSCTIPKVTSLGPNVGTCCGYPAQRGKEPARIEAIHRSWDKKRRIRDQSTALLRKYYRKAQPDSSHKNSLANNPLNPPHNSAMDIPLNTWNKPSEDHSQSVYFKVTEHFTSQLIHRFLLSFCQLVQVSHDFLLLQDRKQLVLLATLTVEWNGLQCVHPWYQNRSVFLFPHAFG